MLRLPDGQFRQQAVHCVGKHPARGETVLASGAAGKFRVPGELSKTRRVETARHALDRVRNETNGREIAGIGGGSEPGARPIVVGRANADPYPEHSQAIGALARYLGMTLDRERCYPYRRG